MYQLDKNCVYVRKTSPNSLLPDIENIFCEIGIPGLDKTKKTLIKINGNFDKIYPGSNTSPWFLDSLLKVLRNCEFLDLAVVEGDLPDFSATKMIRNTGLIRILDKYKVPFIAYEDLPRDEHKLPNILKEAQLINVPVFHGHGIAVISCATKNLFGLLPKDRRKYHYRLSAKLLELTKYLSVFTIVDGTVGLAGESTRRGEPKRLDLIMAGWNPLTIDAVAAVIMGYQVEEIPLLVLSNEQGLLTKDITLKGDFNWGNLPHYKFRFKYSGLRKTAMFLESTQLFYIRWFLWLEDRFRRLYHYYNYWRRYKFLFSGPWMEYDRVQKETFNTMQSSITMPGVKKNLANKAFITDASQRKAIPIIRSLGNHNIKVIAGESNSWSMGFFSKYCSERFIYPSPTKNSTLFVEWLRDFLRYNHCDVLLPIDSKTMDIITEHLDELSKYTAIPVVNHSVYMKARDKEQTIRIALENNIPCPTTYFLSKIEEIDLIAEKITFPIVIKPRQSEGSRGIAYAWSKNNLYSQYYKIHRYYPLPLIQEYIPAGGSTIGVELLFNKNSEPRAIFAHKRIREYPVSGGPSTLSESVYAPRAVEMGIKLLKALGWYGVAMIEFKIDPRDNTPKLMEINPKFWGSIQLPIICGVDFPYLLYRMATEGDVAPVFDYKVGVRCRWLIPGDILHFLNNPNRFRLKPNFFKFMDKNLYYDILSINDPGPFLGMCIGFLLKIFNKETWRDLCR